MTTHKLTVETHDSKTGRTYLEEVDNRPDGADVIASAVMGVHGVGAVVLLLWQGIAADPVNTASTLTGCGLLLVSGIVFGYFTRAVGSSASTSATRKGYDK